MTEEHARDILHHIMLAVQRLRSQMMEEEVEEAFIELVHPWLSEKKSIITGLEMALNKDPLQPGDFYNLVSLAYRTDLIRRWMLLKDLDLPEPDGNWLKGWKPL